MEIQIYTDGGCSGNKRNADCPGAWAYLLVDPSGTIIDQGDGKMLNTTNNRMEMMAVIKGLQKVKFYFDQYCDGSKNNECVVISDSKYIVDNIHYLDGWIKKGWTRSGGGSVINSDLWKEINAFFPEYKSLTFRWVQGHGTNMLNQKADALVRAHLYPT